MRTAAMSLALSLAAACAGAGGSADPGVPTGMERVWCEELSVVAERRLACDRDELECRYAGSRVTLIEGCGRRIRYLVFEQDGIWVKIESFHERAAFELKCGADGLAIERETSDLWRASGCGREERYKLRCGGDGVTCEWAQDDGW
jgi:hypothetical protein